MTLDEWHAVLERGPLTGNQLGRIHAEFRRLGFHVDRDRGERLWLTGELSGAGPIGSTRELTMGEAGRMVGILTGCRSVRELYALAEPEPRGVLAALIAWLTK
ncbi:MAG: hypothetical protein ACRDPD_02760 [Streptosporangiaceae bacterium]